MCCTKITLQLEGQKGCERATYLEPLHQLQRLAVVLVCFKDDICQFMYDHVQRALVFKGFGEVKLKKPERNLLLKCGGSEALVPVQGIPITQVAFTHCLYFDTSPKSLKSDISLAAKKTLLRYLILSSTHLTSCKSSEIVAKHPSSKGLSVLLLHPEQVFPTSALFSVVTRTHERNEPTIISATNKRNAYRALHPSGLRRAAPRAGAQVTNTQLRITAGSSAAGRAPSCREKRCTQSTANML